MPRAHAECVLFVCLYRTLCELLTGGAPGAHPATFATVREADVQCSDALWEVIQYDGGQLDADWPGALDRLVYQLEVEDVLPFRLKMAWPPLVLKKADPARDLTRALARTLRYGLCGAVARSTGGSVDGLNALLRTLLEGELRTAVGKMAQVWGVGDVEKRLARVQVCVAPAPLGQSLGLSGLGIQLGLGGDLVRDGGGDLELGWVFEQFVRDAGKRRGLADYLLFTGVGLVHEFGCHCDNDGPLTPVAPNDSQMHGWMTYVQVVAERDETGPANDVRGALRGRAVKQAAEPRSAREPPPWLRNLQMESRGWNTAKALHGRLNLVDLTDRRCPRIPGCRVAEITAWHAIEALTRWSVRKQARVADVMCDDSRAGLSAGGECLRLRRLGKTLRRKIGDDEVTDPLVAAIETTLKLDLSHWW